MALWKQNFFTCALAAVVAFEMLSLWSYALRETMGWCILVGFIFPYPKGIIIQHFSVNREKQAKAFEFHLLHSPGTYFTALGSHQCDPEKYKQSPNVVQFWACDFGTSEPKDQVTSGYRESHKEGLRIFNSLQKNGQPDYGPDGRDTGVRLSARVCMSFLSSPYGPDRLQWQPNLIYSRL
jgi:hypothetical protein